MMRHTRSCSKVLLYGLVVVVLTHVSTVSSFAPAAIVKTNRRGMVSCSRPRPAFSVQNDGRSPSFALPRPAVRRDDERDGGGGAHDVQRSVLSLFAAVVLSLQSSFAMLPPAPAFAEGARPVGSISGSGLVFKDTLNIEAFDDPKVQGVTLYVSTFQRPLTERVTKGFFSDPSAASVGCVRTGPIKVADNINTSNGGEEVFEESRSLLFKTLRVQRIFDQEKNTVVYVNFNTRLNKNNDTNNSRFKSSVCAVSLD